MESFKTPRYENNIVNPKSKRTKAKRWCSYENFKILSKFSANFLILLSSNIVANALMHKSLFRHSFLVEMLILFHMHYLRIVKRLIVAVVFRLVNGWRY